MRLFVLLLPLLVVVGDTDPRRGTVPGGAIVAQPARSTVRSSLDQVQFVPNLGQWDAAVRYAVLGDTLGWLHDDGYTLQLERWEAPPDGAATAPRTRTGCVVRTRFVGAQPPTFAAGPELSAKRHFFCGDDPRTWRSDVPCFDRVTMGAVYPGVDVVFRPLPDGRRGPFEYDLVLAAGADLTQFVAHCEGVHELAIDREGRLHARVRGLAGEHELVQEAPVAWQQTPSGRRALRVVFRLLDDTTYGFAAPDLDPAFAAVVDPGVVWGTFLGGGLTDSINAMRWREGVGVWVAGWASSTNFPTTPGAFRTTGGADAFVARLDDAGAALQFATYLGGARAEEVRGLDLGPGDTPTVVGYTQSPDFPVTPGALQPTYRGASLFLDIGDGFVTRLSATGNALLSSTYLGGLYDDVAEAVCVDAVGVTTVAGWTSSPDFAITPGAVQGTLGGAPGAQTDGFITRIAANGQSLVYSTFFGGSMNDEFVALDRDPTTGDVVAAGWSLSVDYPTTANAVRPSFSGAVDGIVTRLHANGTTLGFSTYLGALDLDFALCTRFAPDGTVWVGGTTDSATFPLTVNAPQSVAGGERDGFVTQLAANGQAILFSTRLGGTGADKVRGLDIGPGGIAVVGEAGAGFPVTLDAAQPNFAGGTLDAFLTYLTNGGSTLEYSTYLGGNNQDVLSCVALGSGGLVVVAGNTFSSDFPIAPAGFQSQLLGVEDGVVMKFDLVTTFGDGLSVTAEANDEPQRVAAGEHELLAAVLQNLTARDLVVDSVRLLVAGAGDAPARLSSLRLTREIVGGSGPAIPVAGPLAVAHDNTEIVIALSGCTVPANATVRLRVVADLAADPAGTSAEIAVAVIGADAWTLHAVGAGGGPMVHVASPARAIGPVLVLGELPGDVDGDGVLSVVDVRRQLMRLGSAQTATDCDGDGMQTPADVAATYDAVLGRTTVFAPPTAVSRGAWTTVRGVFTTRLAQAALGGRVLTIGTVTPREVTVFVPADQPPGIQEFVLSVAGQVATATQVDVQ